jgi:hypothetical protein
MIYSKRKVQIDVLVKIARGVWEEDVREEKRMGAE